MYFEKRTISGKNIWYCLDDKGKLWLNFHNLCGIFDRKSMALQKHWSGLPSKDKMMRDNRRGKKVMYTTTSIFLSWQDWANKNYVSGRLVDLLYDIEQFKKEQNVNKHLNKLEFNNIDDLPTRQGWFVDEDSITWYDSIDILVNIGFRRTETSVTEDLGKDYLDCNEPYKIRAGRRFWNKESIHTLYKMLEADSDSPKHLSKWDNIQAIFNLVNSEIKDSKLKIDSLTSEVCFLLKDVSKEDLQMLKGNGWKPSQVNVKPLGSQKIIYNKKLHTLKDCIAHLEKKLNVAQVKKDLKDKPNLVIDNRPNFPKGDPFDVFGRNVPPSVYWYLGGAGDKLNKVTNFYEKEILSSSEVEEIIKCEKPLIEDEVTTEVKIVPLIEEDETLMVKVRNFLIIYKEVHIEHGFLSKKETWKDKTMTVTMEDLESVINSFGEGRQTIAVFEI